MMKRTSLIFLMILLAGTAVLTAQETDPAAEEPATEAAGEEPQAEETAAEEAPAEDTAAEGGEEGAEEAEGAEAAAEEEEAAQMEASRLDPDYVRKAETAEVNGSVFVNSDVFFKLSSEDAGTGVQAIEYAIDNGTFMEYSNPFNILTEGNHIVSYRGIDNGENMEQPKTYQVTVDNSAPAVDLGSDRALYKDDGNIYCSPDTNFYVSAKDAPSGVGMDLAYGGYSTDEMYSSGNGERTTDNFFTMEGSGEVVYYYAAMDKVGNLTPVNQFRVYVDDQAPVASLAGSTNLKKRNGEYVVIPSEDLTTEDNRYIVSNATRLAFEAEDDLSGVDAIYVKINDEDYVKYYEPIELADYEEYTIMVKTEDNVGNMSEPKEFLFSVDFVEPESSLDLVDSEGSDL